MVVSSQSMMKEREGVRMNEKSENMSLELKRIITRKWEVSFGLAAVVVILYFGFVGMLAFNKAFFAGIFYGNITVGIPIGIGLIFISWLLTGVYVLWANKRHDPLVEEFRKERGYQ